MRLFFFGLLVTGCNLSYHIHGFGVHGWSHRDDATIHQPRDSSSSGSGSDLIHNLGRFRPNKLFVFGDSYADTGNNPVSVASSWKYPYGITFPGKPTGRFSDGRVLTDFFARYMRVKSPTAYRWRKYGGERSTSSGMNFATGGTGVFQTLAPGPNMTTQIHFLSRLLADGFFSATDLRSSVALVTLAGNDYAAYMASGNATMEGLRAFVPKVVNQLVVNLRLIKEVGVTKVAVTALQPLGCLPRATVDANFQSCNATENAAVSFHNLLLNQALTDLNRNAAYCDKLPQNEPPFVLLDLYSSFTSVLNTTATPAAGESKFGNALEPCCKGIGAEYYCGSVDVNGTKMYTVCQRPESAFFWDSVHPTQRGWQAVYSVLRSNLQQICCT